MWHQWCVRRETRTRQGKSVILAVTLYLENEIISHNQRSHVLEIFRKGGKGSEDSYTKFQIFVVKKYGVPK